MNIIPLGLFLLGVIFLLVGWRWQSPRSNENMVVLKGLAYLKSEIVRVQDQVYVLEDEIIKTKRLNSNRLENQAEVNPVEVNHTALDPVKTDLKDVVAPMKRIHQEMESKELKHQEIGLRELENQTEHIQKAKLYSISSQEQRGRSTSKKLFDEHTISVKQASDSAPQADYHSSGKYTEVLELAAQGQHIPEISQRLFLSQDAVRMVLSMQSKGGAR